MAYGEGMTKLSPCSGALVLPMLAEALHGAAPQALLDAGCGRGERLADCAAMWPGAALRGVDLDAENAGLARKNCPGAEIVTGDAGALPWAGGSFASSTFPARPRAAWRGWTCATGC